MSKTVKHCEVCQENFGERFSYCPVCGETLKTVDVGANQAYSASSGAASPAPPPFTPREETVAAAAVTAPLSQDSIPAFVTPEPAAANGSANFKANNPVVTLDNFDTNAENYHDDGLFHLTILQAPKTHRRDFGRGAGFALGFMFVALTALLVWDIFNFPLDIDAVDAEMGIAYASLSNDEPTEVEEVEPIKKVKEDAGGGGGGGKNDPKPVQSGVMPKMTKQPQEIAPDVDRVINEKFELKQTATVQGPEIKQPPTMERYGVANGGKDASAGMGSGRGLGNGYGTGIGPKPVAVVSEPLKILSQPRPGYTEEARKNNVQGTVRVRVTFSASGQVTGVSAVSSLPFGLTEKAIAAARQIQFVPAKRNGVATAVTKTIEYRFTMY